METKILEVNGESLALAREIILGGGLVAMPTETVYGLGADGTNGEAVKKIYAVKGRPTDNPLIAHVHKDYDLNKLVFIEQSYAEELKKAFMPGPLTMVFYSRGVVSREATCGGDTLAVRIPSHEGAQAFLRAVDLPVVAPSANVSKHVSPVTARHVFDDLNGKIPLILDGGKCSGGIESTVLDVTEKVPRILRAGLITREMIASVAGDCVYAEHRPTDKVRSPGGSTDITCRGFKRPALRRRKGKKRSLFTTGPSAKDGARCCSARTRSPPRWGKERRCCSEKTPKKWLRTSFTSCGRRRKRAI